MERAQAPFGLPVGRGEQGDFDDDPEARRLAQKLSVASEILRVPALQIEPVAAARVSRGVAAGPGRQEAAGPGGQSVARDAERLGRHLYVAAPEDPRVVEAVGGQRGQVLPVIEI